MTLPPFDEHLDLELGRDIALPPALLWRVWTTPALLQQWWAPAPLTTPECEMELQPGGVFRTVMQAPDGARYPTSGCFLDIVPQRRLVFSDALQPGFRPASKPFFTAIISLTRWPTAAPATTRACCTRTPSTARPTPTWASTTAGAAAWNR